MAAKRDYYEILGVPRTATSAEIKRAYRRQALELHPDVNPSPHATQQFQELGAAYETLSNPLRRSVYDRMGSFPPYRAQPYRGSPTGRSSSTSSQSSQSSRTGTGPTYARAGRAYTAQPPRPAPGISYRRVFRGFIRNPLAWFFAVIPFASIIGILSGGIWIGYAGWFYSALFSVLGLCFVLLHEMDVVRAYGRSVGRVRANAWMISLIRIAFLLGFLILLFAVVVGIPIALFEIGNALHVDLLSFMSIFYLAALFGGIRVGKPLLRIIRSKLYEHGRSTR